MHAYMRLPTCVLQHVHVNMWDITGNTDAKFRRFRHGVHLAFQSKDLEKEVNTLLGPKGFSIKIPRNIDIEIFGRALLTATNDDHS